MKICTNAIKYGLCQENRIGTLFGDLMINISYHCEYLQRKRFQNFDKALLKTSYRNNDTNMDLSGDIIFLFQELLYFLAKVVEDEDSNRMSLANVAMIMAPNLFPPPRLKKSNLKNNDLAAEVTVAAMSSKVTQLLIRYGNFLGTVSKITTDYRIFLSTDDAINVLNIFINLSANSH